MTGYSSILEEALENYEFFPRTEVPLESLPLLVKLRDRFKSQSPFAEIDVLFIQHHLGSFPGRLNAMIDCGLDPGRTWFIDIPYSTHTDVIDKLHELHFPSNQMTDQLTDPLEPYNEAQSKRVSSLMESLEKRKNPRPLLVVDDGAYFARYLKSLQRDDPDRLKLYMGTSVVEQTTRGHRYLFNDALDVLFACGISVVSIARCKTKTIFEGPFIGAAQALVIRNYFKKQENINAKNAAIIGCGVVGKSTLKELCRLYPYINVDVVDIDASVRSRLSNGVPQLRNDREYDIVIGCTGYNSFHLDQRSLLADGALLVSGSSAAIEFNRAAFIELADRYPDDEIEILDRVETVAKGLHTEIKFRQEGGKVFSFLNAGFPVNFDGSLESLPSKIIQATHGLMFIASIQTLMQKGPGINTIDPIEDNRVLEEAFDQLAS